MTLNKSKDKVTKFLVCGGREFLNEQFIHGILNSFRAAMEDCEIFMVHGDCPTGADNIAYKWADANGIPNTEHKYRAEWTKYGKSAGFRRNRKMMYEEIPDIVIAFPGGPGTKNMLEISEEYRKKHKQSLVIVDLTDLWNNWKVKNGIQD